MAVVFQYKGALVYWDRVSEGAAADTAREELELLAADACSRSATCCSAHMMQARSGVPEYLVRSAWPCLPYLSGNECHALAHARCVC